MSRIAELAAVLERAGVGPDYDPAQLSAALERARVVGVLDAWAAKPGNENYPFKTQPAEGFGPEDSWCCWSESVDVPGRKQFFYGPDPDAARAAAAKAIEAGEV